ncbi:hypothetical protein BJ742DRAFT_869796 [Cladochytrium replicatum]|nr:hypothetical protein BJ742DRAFT_869796 [Cladochytrium replicatum]
MVDTAVEQNESVDAFKFVLYRQLAPYRIPDEDYFPTHQGSMFMVKRLLGMYPQTMTTMGLYPPTADWVGKVAMCMNHSPVCDLGVGVLTPQMRRLVQTTTAMVAECGYCTAHNCGLGNVFRGGLMHKKGQTKPFPLALKEMTVQERAAIRVVVASVKVPSQMTPEIRNKAVSDLGSEANYQIVIKPMILIGYLSTIMETMGAEIEEECYEFAKKVLGEPGTNWAVNAGAVPPWGSSHAYSPYHDPSVPDFATSWLTRTIGSNPITDIIDLFVNIPKANAGSPKTDVPLTSAGIDDWYKSELGFVPRTYGSDLLEPALKHCVAFTFESHLLKGALPAVEGEISPPPGYPASRAHIALETKLLMAFVYFVSGSNGLLARHFAYVFHTRFPESASSMLGSALSVARRNDPPKSHTALSFLYTMAYLEARRDRASLVPLTSRATALIQPPHAIVEALGILGACAFLQRLVSAMDVGKGLEPELEKFYTSEDPTAKWVEFELSDLAPTAGGLKKGNSSLGAEGDYDLEQLWGGRIKI